MSTKRSRSNQSHPESDQGEFSSHPLPDQFTPMSFVPRPSLPRRPRIHKTHCPPSPSIMSLLDPSTHLHLHHHHHDSNSFVVFPPYDTPLANHYQRQSNMPSSVIHGPMPRTLRRRTEPIVFAATTWRLGPAIPPFPDTRVITSPYPHGCPEFDLVPKVAIPVSKTIKLSRECNTPPPSSNPPTPPSPLTPISPVSPGIGFQPRKNLLHVAETINTTESLDDQLFSSVSASLLSLSPPIQSRHERIDSSGSDATIRPVDKELTTPGKANADNHLADDTNTVDHQVITQTHPRDVFARSVSPVLPAQAEVSGLGFGLYCGPSPPCSPKTAASSLVRVQANHDRESENSIKGKTKRNNQDKKKNKCTKNTKGIKQVESVVDQDDTEVNLDWLVEHAHNLRILELSSHGKFTSHELIGP